MVFSNISRLQNNRLVLISIVFDINNSWIRAIITVCNIQLTIGKYREK